MQKSKPNHELKDLLIQHEALLEKQARNEPIVDEVGQFVLDLQEAGKSTAPTEERNQLRALLRYWSGFIYEKTGAFPSYELQPYSGPPVINRSALLVPAVVVLIGLSIVGVAALLLPPRQSASNYTAEPVSSAVAAQLFTREAQQTATQQYLDLHPDATRLALTPTATSPAATLTPPPTPTPTPAGPDVSLYSPQNGQDMKPDTIISGQYANLQEGWSILVLLRPVSSPDRYYPIKEYFTVPQGIPSGDWAIYPHLENTLKLDRPDQFDIQIVIVTSGGVLKELLGQSSLPGVPKGAIPMQTAPARVSIDAYTILKGPHLLYSAYSDETSQYDLYVAELDGSNPQRIKMALSASERGMSVLDHTTSPKGDQLAFIGRQTFPAAGGGTEKRLELRISSSTGQNQRRLAVKPAGFALEQVRWSPDGRYLAYSGGAADQNGKTDWEIYLYDLASGQECQLTDSKNDVRFPSWYDDRTLVAVRSNRLLIALEIPEECDPPKVKITEMPLPAGREELNIFRPVAYHQGEIDRIAFIGYTDPNGFHDVFVWDRPSQQVYHVTNNEKNAMSPAFGLNGQTAYYQSGEPLFQVDWNGRNRKLIPGIHGDNLVPYVGEYYGYFPAK
jgi:type II secretory pathway pseudopilin PulG